jgi:hypothetical protein
MMHCPAHKRHIQLLPLALLLLCFAGCGGHSDERASVLKWAPNMEDAGAEARPPNNERASAPGGLDASDPGTPYPELHDFLMSELTRLGKDPARTTSEVAKGDSDRVFDLKPSLIDPDGPGGEPATGVTLDWTEVLIGDYDQNGLVTIAEITALGQNLGKSVDYDAPALHGGFAYWPAGDPADDGGATPPAPGSPAANWRLSRVDGNRDGQLTINDITPIAVHWQEALSGYRIYRQAPGESQFTMLPGLPGTNDFLSVEHPSATGNAPVLYSFADDNATASGVYLYYVAPYDLQSQAQGPASGIVSIDFDTGTVNSSPVANLSVTPDFAGAPAEITLDASASYDPDGSIAAYEWDFDGDGITDWTTGDPLPATSSSGTVDSFEEVEPGVIRATYRQGSDDYYAPSVSVQDEMSLASIPSSAQLGIAGWELETLFVTPEDYKLWVDFQQMSIDPVTNELVVAGYHEDYRKEEEYPNGVYFSRRSKTGDWTIEHVDVPLVGQFINGIKYVAVVRKIVWNEGNFPMLLLQYRKEIVQSKAISSFWTANRTGSNKWVVEEQYLSSAPEEHVHIGTGMLSYVQLNEGRAAALLVQTSSDGNNPNLLYHHFRFYIAYYEKGQWRVDYTGYDQDETELEPRSLMALPDGDLVALFKYGPGVAGGVWGAKYTPGEELGERYRLDGGAVTFDEPFYPYESDNFENGAYTVYRLNNDIKRYQLVVNDGGQFSSYKFISDDSYAAKPYFAHKCKGELSLIYYHNVPGVWPTEYLTIKNGTLSSTSFDFYKPVEYEGGFLFRDAVQDYNERVIAFIEPAEANYFPPDGRTISALLRRLDPRLLK